MASNELQQILSESATEVLESMFFTSPLESSAFCDGPTENSIAAGLFFRGTPPGRFGICASMDAARSLAASFLGEDLESMGEQQCGEVICELANMVCGSVLSRLEKDVLFELTQPKIGEPYSSRPEGASVSLTLELEEGSLLAWILVEEAR
jgi:CheY-specific phosphatase CheX